MMTKQNDTATMTEEQLDGVAGGISNTPNPSFRGDVPHGDPMRGSYVSISPVPTPIPKVLFPRGRARIVWPNY